MLLELELVIILSNRLELVIRIIYMKRKASQVKLVEELIELIVKFITFLIKKVKENFWKMMIKLYLIFNMLMIDEFFSS